MDEPCRAFVAAQISAHTVSVRTIGFSTERKQGGFYPFGGGRGRGAGLPAGWCLFVEAATSDLADCGLSGGDYVPTEGRQQLMDGVDPGH